MSERTWQGNDRTLWRAKNADTFKPMGPWIETDFDLDAAQTIIRVNGEEGVHFKTNSMIFGAATFISRMSQYLTLYPGDVCGWAPKAHPKSEARRHGRHRDHRHRHLAKPGGARRPVTTPLFLSPVRTLTGAGSAGEGNNPSATPRVLDVGRVISAANLQQVSPKSCSQVLSPPRANSAQCREHSIGMGRLFDHPIAVGCRLVVSSSWRCRGLTSPTRA